MKFLSKLLGKEEVESMISLVEHQRIVAECDAAFRHRGGVILQLNGDVKGLRSLLQQERETVARLVARERKALDELAATKDDLADANAKIARMMAPLIAANERRKSQAREKQAAE